MIVGKRSNLEIILIAGCLISLLSFGIRSSMGFFNVPLTEGFNYPIKVYFWAMAIQNLLWGLMQPIAGAFADRFGSWRVLIFGSLIYALGLILMSLDLGPLTLSVSAGFLIGTGVAGTSFGLVMAAFSRLVDPSQRVWAMGIATAAGSMGQFLLIPIVQVSIATFGWIPALYFMTFLALLIIPLALQLRGGKAINKDPVSDLTLKQTFSEAIKEAFSHPGYLMLNSGFFACGFLLAFVTIALPKYVVSEGLETSQAAYTLSAVGLFNIVGAYMAGIWGSKFSKKHLLSAIYFARIIGIVWILVVPLNTVTLIIFGAFMGLLWLSTVPLTNALIAQIFGMKYLATLYGFVFLSHQLGSFCGLVLAAYSESIYGSLVPMWYACIAVNLFAVLIHLPINQKPLPRIADPAS